MYNLTWHWYAVSHADKLTLVLQEGYVERSVQNPAGLLILEPSFQTGVTSSDLFL
jgi:hypothetical protein